MKEMPKSYDHQGVEDRLYEKWEKNGYFHAEPNPDKEPYCIVIPPPNITGQLHIGHAIDETLQDALIRYKRMAGFETLWLPGTDHASIATEVKIIEQMAKEGLDKRDIGRGAFLQRAWDWKKEYGGRIVKQLRKLGASCDWDRTAFTMDETRSRAVIHVFCDLYQKGLIYRGVRMVNWDPKAQTALSDEEVIYKDEHSKLYHLKYYVVEQDCQQVDEENVMHKDEKGYYAVVATTRPETIMGDSAMCINPEDKKNTWLKGKHVIVPLVNREIPVIEDTYVDIEFGTGCLKVTPAHDINDHALGLKHGLETIDIFNDNGTISEAAGLYVGMDRMDVRKQDTIKNGAEFIGNRTRVKIVKNKVAPPFKTAEFDMIYGEGISRESCILDMAVDQKIINKTGAWYSYNDMRMAQGRDNARLFLKDNKELCDEIEARVREKMMQVPAKTEEPEEEI